MNPLAHEVGEGKGEGEACRTQHSTLSRPTGEEDSYLAAIRRRVTRHAKAQREGEPSFGGYLAQVGVLGWIIVLPTLLGVFAGRWVDRWLGTGIFWTGPSLMAGLAMGCWSAWRWVHRP